MKWVYEVVSLNNSFCKSLKAREAIPSDDPRLIQWIQISKNVDKNSLSPVYSRFYDAAFSYGLWNLDVPSRLEPVLQDIYDLLRV
tara:strand:+ start:1200 stop:1454 length:255 start_codon:yes stop_codon:yes gene_type:complete